MYVVMTRDWRQVVTLIRYCRKIVETSTIHTIVCGTVTIPLVEGLIWLIAVPQYGYI